MSEQEVNVTTQQGICHIEINRPSVKNALNQTAYQQLSEAVETADADSHVRVLLISGAGGNFSSGNDLADFSAGKGIDANSSTLRFMRSLIQCEKPVVAAVSGVAVGIGTTLLLHCDLAYADNTATFCMPFNNLGLCCEFASSFILPQLAGRPKAMELILLGETFNAQQAKDLNIICSVQENVFEYAQKQAIKLSKQPPDATRINKALLRQNNHSHIESVMQQELKQFAQCLQGDECKEALSAFFEKRAPNFS